jgi:hypothetical protein
MKRVLIALGPPLLAFRGPDGDRRLRPARRR